MFELMKWYFKSVWEDDPLEESRIITWFGRIYGTLMSPFIFLLAGVVMVFIKINDKLEEMRWH